MTKETDVYRRFGLPAASILGYLWFTVTMSSKTRKHGTTSAC